MPKLQNPAQDEAAFLASVQLSINKAYNKAKQNRRAFEVVSKPDYWKEQKARIDKAKSWDILAEYISI
jgi:hypothetical protein